MHLYVGVFKYFSQYINTIMIYLKKFKKNVLPHLIEIKEYYFYHYVIIWSVTHSRIMSAAVLDIFMANMPLLFRLGLRCPRIDHINVNNSLIVYSVIGGSK